LQNFANVSLFRPPIAKTDILNYHKYQVKRTDNPEYVVFNQAIFIKKSNSKRMWDKSHWYCF